MNIANVTSRFALVANLDNSEIYKWRILIGDACNYVYSHLKKRALNKNEKRRVEVLCALYAYRLYSLYKAENITLFTAGDVRIESSGDEIKKANDLWYEYAGKWRDLIDSENFLFGRVI